MIPQNIITELFMYFARFPKREGIYPLFNIGESTIPGYNELKTQVDNLTEHSLVDIDNYIFAANLEAVKARVNNIAAGENYLFVDFGEIDSDIDQRNRHIDSAALAISVAYRMNSFSADTIEQSLVFAHSFDKLVAIRNKIIEEQECQRWLKLISDNHRFVPLVSENLSSLGWTMMFDREGYDTFNAKGI